MPEKAPTVKVIVEPLSLAPGSAPAWLLDSVTSFVPSVSSSAHGTVTVALSLNVTDKVSPGASVVPAQLPPHSLVEVEISGVTAASTVSGLASVTTVDPAIMPSTTSTVTSRGARPDRRRLRAAWEWIAWAKDGLFWSEGTTVGRALAGTTATRCRRRSRLA